MVSGGHLRLSGAGSKPPAAPSLTTTFCSFGLRLLLRRSASSASKATARGARRRVAPRRAARQTRRVGLRRTAALALRSRCARAALALRSRCARAAPALRSCCARAALHTRRPPGSRRRGLHDDGSSPPSSSLPSCRHCAVIIHANSPARLSLSRARSRSRVMMLLLRSRCTHTRARVSSALAIAPPPCPVGLRAAQPSAIAPPSPRA